MRIGPPGGAIRWIVGLLNNQKTCLKRQVFWCEGVALFGVASRDGKGEIRSRSCLTGAQFSAPESEGASRPGAAREEDDDMKNQLLG